MVDDRDADVLSEATRDDFVGVSARLSRILGACELGTLDIAVEECLEQVGRHLAVDVAFVILVDDEERITDDWRWVGVDRRLDAPVPRSPLRDTFGSVTEFLRLGHTIAVNDLADIDLAPTERALANANQLRAIVTAPVRVGSTLLGIMGLQRLDQPHHWERGEIRIVERVAELLVKTVIRTRDRGALAAANARARRIADFLPDGLLLLDLAGAVTFASRSFARATGMDAATLLTTQLTDMVHPDDRDLLTSTMNASSHLGSGLVVRMGAGDDWCWSELSWQRIHEPETGVDDEIVVSVRDVHDKHVAGMSLAQQHERDPLTGLLDRRGFERTIAELARSNARITIGFIDVDHFKSVNDSRGHTAGDEVLCTVATALVEAVRHGDLVARIGGDEFCVVARADSEWSEAPGALGHRLCSAVENRLHGSKVTISIGIAGPGFATDAERLRNGADAAMYAAKRDGGGRYMIDADDQRPLETQGQVNNFT